MLSRFFARRLIQWMRDRRGSAAVEFAFVAPVMILVYYGIAETTMGMMAERRNSRIASTIGDLVAQDTQITSSEMTDIFTVGRAIMSPFATTTLSMRVTSVKADSSGTPKVVWSKVSGSGYAVLTGTVSGVPANLLAANESAIMTEATYGYTSAVQKALPRAITFSKKYYLKPRKTTEVSFSS